MPNANMPQMHATTKAINRFRWKESAKDERSLDKLKSQDESQAKRRAKLMKLVGPIKPEPDDRVKPDFVGSFAGKCKGKIVCISQSLGVSMFCKSKKNDMFRIKKQDVTYHAYSLLRQKKYDLFLGWAQDNVRRQQVAKKRQAIAKVDSLFSVTLGNQWSQLCSSNR